jgi:hypothetical protein
MACRWGVPLDSWSLGGARRQLLRTGLVLCYSFSASLTNFYLDNSGRELLYEACPNYDEPNLDDTRQI